MKCKRFPLLSGTVVMALLGIGSYASAADPVVIVNSGVALSALDRGTVEKIFLGRTSDIGGQKAVLAVLSGGSTHEDFTREYLSKTPEQFTNHWRKIVFTGKGKQPRTFDDESELVAFVARTPGAIGYIGGTTAHGEVRVVAVN